MNPQDANPSVRQDPTAVPAPKWWGRYVVDGNPPERRFLVLWRRILIAVGVLAIFCYVSAATALWGYYSVHRGIPGVQWVDVAIPPRFSHVQDAIGAYYLVQAKEAWAKKDYAKGIVTTRAALVKSPGNLDARLFLAKCWLDAGRYGDAIRVLREGISYNAGDARLQAAIVDICLVTNHFADLLTVLRTDFPAKGVRLLDGTNRAVQLAEVRSVLEVSGPAEADRTAASHPGLTDDPSAAPLLARIDGELGRKKQALERLRTAHERSPQDANIQYDYVTTALELGDDDVARKASEDYFTAYPGSVAAQLRYLEAHSDREGRDQTQWSVISLRFLVQHQHDPEALSQLGSLAASKGWSDITYLLYENSLQENLTGFPFAIYYVASLVKTADFQAADATLRELSIRNSSQVQESAYLAAMIDWGTGRESEAMQIVQQLRRETADDLRRRRTIESVFRSFGFLKVADQLVAAGS